MLKRLSTAVAGLVKKSRAKTARRDLPLLWVMSDIARLPDPSSILTFLPAHNAVIVRHPHTQERRALAERLKPLCRSQRIKVLISEDWRLAAALRCDGVHMPERAVNQVRPGLRLWRKSKRALLTTSAHGPEGILNAGRIRADLVFLSPVLATRSHPERVPIGRIGFAKLALRARCPTAALGGITLRSIRTLNGTRCAAIGGISFALEKAGA
ncbi:MAG: hypothetical protein EXR11_01870 [Rhodospirillaceae bacterium]|nr:hypothetical protein [Rhodospirillaceae bacterium]